MEKRRILLPALALVLVLSQCSRRESDPVQAAPGGQPFELFAPSSETRTVNDGLSTLWAQGDALGVFHAPASSSNYVADGEFIIDEAATGHATGTVLPIPDGSYDWFVQYPYTGAASLEMVPLVFGTESGPQQQAGYGSTAHLAGAGFPLAGAAAGVDRSEIPTVTVNPLAAAVSITVTNTLAEPVRITSVTLTAPEAVVGLFLADMTGETPIYTPESASSATSEVSVEVSGGTDLATGESAVIYLGCKPFTASAGSELTLAVTARNTTGLAATHTKTVTLSAETAFRAGYIRKLSFGFAGEYEEPDPDVYVFYKASALEAGKKYLFVVNDGGTTRMMLSRKGTETQLTSAPVEVVNESITLETLDDAILISQAYQTSGALIEGAYTFRQENGQFIGVNQGTSSQYLAFSSSATSNAYWWAATAYSYTARTKVFCYLPDNQVFTAVPSASDSGVYPELYRLRNESESTEELLNKTEYGAYGIPDWVYEAGTMQLSFLKAAAGTNAFRIIHPSDKIVTEISALPASYAVDDEFTLHVLRFENGKTKMDKDFLVSVLKIESGRAWLLSPTGAGFIVMYQ